MFFIYNTLKKLKYAHSNQLVIKQELFQLSKAKNIYLFSLFIFQNFGRYDQTPMQNVSDRTNYKIDVSLNYRET